MTTELVKERFSSNWRDEKGRLYLEYRFPLRPDVLCSLILPRDLTKADCERLATHIATLVAP